MDVFPQSATQDGTTLSDLPVKRNVIALYPPQTATAWRHLERKSSERPTTAAISAVTRAPQSLKTMDHVVTRSPVVSEVCKSRLPKLLRTLITWSRPRTLYALRWRANDLLTVRGRFGMPLTRYPVKSDSYFNRFTSHRVLRKSIAFDWVHG